MEPINGISKGGEHPLCDILIGGGVNTPPAKWLRLMDAAVILPDHLHCIWTLPRGDADFATRWRLVKTWFSKHCGSDGSSGYATLTRPTATKEAPSRMAIIGRYILRPELFSILENLPAGKGREIQLTDRLSQLVRERQVYGRVF